METPEHPTCPTCGQPLTGIEHFSERLEGCLNCNLWGAPGSISLERKLPDEDVVALRAFRRPPSLA